MTTLKSATLWCCRLEVPWTAQDVAEMANVDPNAAKAYLNRLATDGVLQRAEVGSYRAGNRELIQKLRTTPTNAKPGGGGAAYRRGKAARDRLLDKEALARRTNTILTSLSVTNDHKPATIAQADFSAGMLTATEVAKLLHVCRMTVYRYVQEGRLPVGRLPTGHRRFGLADVHRFINDISRSAT